MNAQNPARFEVSLKILLINKKNEFLILKARYDHPRFAGKYDLPGGRINKKEANGNNFHFLIIREIKEEVGNIKFKLRKDPVSLAKYNMISRKHPGRDGVIYILFVAKYLNGKINISNEHLGFKWIKLDKTEIKRYFHPVLQQLVINYFSWDKIK